MRRKDMYTVRCKDLPKPLVFRTHEELSEWLLENPKVRGPIWVTNYDRRRNAEITWLARHHEAPTQRPSWQPGQRAGYDAAMTEAEWHNSDLDTLLGLVKGDYSPRNVPGWASERKLRLFACACCRRIWHLLRDERCRDAVLAGERYADGKATRHERDTACRAAGMVLSLASDERDSGTAARNDPAVPAARAAFYAAAEAETQWDEYTPYVPDAGEVADDCAEAVTLADGEVAGRREAAAQRALFHDIIANPFRPVVLDGARLTDAVIQLARTIYIERAFDRIPELADALETAGCKDADVLNHCRNGAEHVRGCWVVDLVLGKS